LKKNVFKSIEDDEEDEDEDDDDMYADLSITDIKLVMQQVSVSKKKAAETLRKYNGDLINTIMSLQK